MIEIGKVVGERCLLKSKCTFVCVCLDASASVHVLLPVFLLCRVCVFVYYIISYLSALFFL